jgi:uncharacterized circularly permuted ATP-grasp superfamily protein
MQVYWMSPASWLLDEFTVTDSMLTIVRKNGDRFEAPLSQIEATFAVDNYDRREINIRYGEKKTRFKEIPGMLSEEEWDEIIAVLNPRKSGLGKLNDMLRGIKKVLEDD